MPLLDILLSVFVKLFKGCAMSEKWVMNRRQKFPNPKNDRVCLTVVGTGQSRIPPSLIGSIEIFPSSTIIPRYSIRVLLNSHFNAFKKRSFSRNRCSTNLVYRSKSSWFLAKIRISSMYMMTMHPSIMSTKMASIIPWKVAGELHIPKNITVGSNNPLFVLKAAFHSSPFFIRTLLYPHLTSNFVKYFAPFSLSMISEIRGNGYAFLIVQSFR